MQKTPIPSSIDLPAPPLWATTAEGSLSNAAINIYLLGGDLVHGKLIKLSAANEVLLVQLASQEEPAAIEFAKFSYLLFTHKLSVAKDRFPAELYRNDDSLPSPFQSFSVTSINDETVGGKARGSFEDKSGVHIFKAVNEQSIQRLFFPAATVKSHRIGRLLGDELVRNAAASQEDVDKALKLQKSLRTKQTVDYLVESKAVSAEQLREVAGSKEDQAANREKSQSSEKITERLIGENKISAEQLTHAMQQKESDHAEKIGTCLTKMKVVNDQDLHRALANKSGIPFVSLSEFNVDPEAIKLVSLEIANKYSLLPLSLLDQKLVVAMEDPFDTEAIDTVQFITNLHLELVTATKESIDAAIAKNYEVDTFEQDVLAAEDVQRLFSLDKKQERELREVEMVGSGQPIVRLVANFVMDAIHQRASDIHIRPLDKSVDLLFRIDGTLFKIRNFSKTLLAAIISRIKIIGRMDIAERRLPQDGQARVSDKGNIVDLRISVMPTVNGESAVIRLLNTQVGIKSIAQLGFTARDAEVFTGLLHKSNGMILVTGPTGSGKSTTLYAALQMYPVSPSWT